MKIFSKFLMILGLLLFSVGLLFNHFGWPDLFRGITTGPIVLIVGLCLLLYKKNK